MEASVATPEAPAEPERSHDGAAEATRSTVELFQWSGYVHIGKGSEECEHRQDGQCEDKSHFHAWVCLPNPYQIRDVQEKARAARARRVRALRDPESDSGAILEAELDDLRRDHMEELIEAIASRTVDRELVEIIREVEDRPEFENQAHDAEEFQRLSAIPEGERDEDERQDFERLQEQMLAYGNAMQEIIDRRRKGEADKLRQRSESDIISIEREEQIKQRGDEMFLHTYYTWVIYIGTRVPSAAGFPTQRVFKEPREQKEAPPEVVTALRDKVRELEQATSVERRGDAAGNS